MYILIYASYILLYFILLCKNIQFLKPICQNKNRGSYCGAAEQKGRILWTKWKSVLEGYQGRILVM